VIRCDERMGTKDITSEEGQSDTPGFFKADSGIIKVLSKLTMAE
jgi:hypothetical protein